MKFSTIKLASGMGVEEETEPLNFNESILKMLEC